MDLLAVSVAATLTASKSSVAMCCKIEIQFNVQFRGKAKPSEHLFQPPSRSDVPLCKRQNKCRKSVVYASYMYTENNPTAIRC